MMRKKKLITAYNDVSRSVQGKKDLWWLDKNKNVLESACAGAFVNGSAGKLLQKEFGNHILASDIISVLPTVLKLFDKIKK